MPTDVPDDGFRRQRVLFVLAHCLTKTLRSRVDIGEERGVIPVGRVEASGKLGLVNGDLS